MPEVHFEKIVSEGKALGYFDGRACFCAGPLPGETAEVSLTRSKPRYSEAVLARIIQASSHRGTAREDHSLLCSPWQAVDYPYQLELKRGLLAEAAGRPELGLEVLGMTGSPEQWGYRNKLEFALDWHGDEVLLAWHERGQHDMLASTPEGCVLGSPAMNQAARAVAGRLPGLDLAGTATTLMVRQAEDGVVAIVGLRRKVRRDWKQLLGPELAGVVVAEVSAGHRYSHIWDSGMRTLSETVDGVSVRYAYDGFFQVNVPAFAQALADIQTQVPDRSRIVDLYGGAGSIGLPLARRAEWVRGVEIDRTAVELARDSAVAARVTNYTAESTPAEQLDGAVFEGSDVVVVDPPRAGLHRRVVDRLLQAAPSSIVYLSCNPITQARDLMLLMQSYATDGVRGYDFYPGTLHVESLAVLRRR
jgi:23S rRNA (uracil1939-C5)-methyltransferase